MLKRLYLLKYNKLQPFILILSFYSREKQKKLLLNISGLIFEMMFIAMYVSSLFHPFL